VAVLLAGIAIVWIAAAVATAVEADHEVREVFDANLARNAALLAMRIGDEADEIDTGHAPTLHKYAKPLSFQVWKRGARLLLHSADAPDTPFSANDHGFSTVTVDGRDWRVFSLRGPEGEYVVQVRDALDEIPPEIVADLMDIGICLAGGGALLQGLADRLTDELKLRVWVAEDPLTCVARGAAAIYEDFDRLSRFLVGLERGSTHHSV